MKKRFRFDCIIVLGGGVTKEGECPEWVKQRLDKALELHNMKLADKIILSGKLSKTLFDNKFNESEVMKKYLLSKGFPEEKIILEGKSRDTFENAYLSKIIVDKNNWKKIIVVTNEFHMKRAKKIFKFIFGKGYRFLFRPCYNGNISYEVLENRIFFEKELLKILNKEVFKKFKKGDTEGIKIFLWDSDRFQKMDHELNIKLNVHKNLY